LNWNNRPYVNAIELMQVPATSAGRLLTDYSTWESEGFYNEVTDAPLNILPYRHMLPYGHLLNFFFSSKYDISLTTSHYTSDYTTTKTASGTHNNDTAVSNFYRIFDYVGVPSPFSGNDTLLNPAVFQANNGYEFRDLNGNGTKQANEPWMIHDIDGDQAWDPGEQGEFAPFYAPFNRLPSYREPGRVNINTISDSLGLSWLGVTNSFNSVAVGAYTPNAHWSNIELSRQGFGTILRPLLNNTFAPPSYFANPFRSYGSANYLPQPTAFAPVDLKSVNSSGDFIDSTFHRRIPDSALNEEPLFSFQTTVGGAYTDPPYTGEFNDSDRNPFFRYQGFQKMANLLTTQSNVYAVWITVGFFEVERTTIDAGNPDGYTLGPEIGADSGEIKRHRMFMILDRTIPVGFERGKNHNVHRAILVKRVIE
jgi:hypothetical protein